MSRSTPPGGRSPWRLTRTGPTAGTWPATPRPPPHSPSCASPGPGPRLTLTWSSRPRTQGYDGLDDDGQPYTEPLPRVPYDPESGISYGDPLAILIQLPSRISRGRPLHLALRAIIAAALSLIVLQLIPAARPPPPTSSD